MDFEKVELTAGPSDSSVESQKEMVLQGNLVSMNHPRMVSYALGR